MPEQVSELFVRLTELADVEGVVPEDGSGVDGVWTTTVPARERDQNWNVAMNADVDEDLTAEDFPDEGEQVDVNAGSAVVFIGGWPAGAFSPAGGTLVADDGEDGPQSIEDELIDDVEARIAALEEADDE